MATVATKQYKLMLDEGVIARMDELARRYRRDSGNKVATEVLALYLDAWEAAETARFRVIENQTKASDMAAMDSPRLSPEDHDFLLWSIRQAELKRRTAKGKEAEFLDRTIQEFKARLSPSEEKQA